MSPLFHLEVQGWFGSYECTLELTLSFLVARSRRAPQSSKCPDQCGSVGWHLPAKWKVTTSIPSQGTCLGCRFGPQSVPWSVPSGGTYEGQPINDSLSHWCFSLLSPFFHLSLKINKILFKSSVVLIVRKRKYTLALERQWPFFTFNPCTGETVAFFHVQLYKSLSRGFHSGATERHYRQQRHRWLMGTAVAGTLWQRFLLTNLDTSKAQLSQFWENSANFGLSGDLLCLI